MLGRYSTFLSGSLTLLGLTMVGGTGLCHAQSTPIARETLASERTLLAKSFASEKLWVWQKRLNLQAWAVSVEVSRDGELKPKTLGNIHWDREKKTAVIRVLDPADYRLPFDAMLRDVEFTVVHELIHLEMVPILSDLQRTDANRTQEEDTVNHLAEALLKLDRGR
jgi:hypothetical protein